VKAKLEPLFATEAALCAAFIAWVQPQGWTAYAETADFDILLAHGDGTQIGIQAKMKFNIAVLAQLVDSSPNWERAGPDFRAVLVPSDGNSHICSALGLGLFETYGRNGKFSPEIGGNRGWEGWHYWNPRKRCTLPAYVPDVIAGSPAPTKLTEWKVAALRVAATLELRGYVTRSDFRLHGIDHRRWTQDWLVADPMTGKWLRGPRTPDFAAQHPVVYPKVRADIAEALALEIAP